MEKIELSRNEGELKRYFVSQADVELAFLFGSQARGQANRFSDVDFAVLLAGSPDDGICFAARLRLIGDLANILKTEEVDLVIINQAPPSLGYRVLRDGLLLFCRNRESYIAYRVQVVNEYLDFKPIMERHEQAILEKARKGELLNGYDRHREALERYRRLRKRLKETPETDLR